MPQLGSGIGVLQATRAFRSGGQRPPDLADTVLPCRVRCIERFVSAVHQRFERRTGAARSLATPMLAVSRMH